MSYYKISIQSGKTSIKSKLLLFLGMLLGVGLLSVFMVSFFTITLLAGAVLFLINLFQSRGKTESPITTSIQTPRYRKSPVRDHDVIDI